MWYVDQSQIVLCSVYYQLTNALPDSWDRCDCRGTQALGPQSLQGEVDKALYGLKFHCAQLRHAAG